MPAINNIREIFSSTLKENTIKKPKRNIAKNQICDNTIQGKLYITDSNGYVCKKNEMEK